MKSDTPPHFAILESAMYPNSIGSVAAVRTNPKSNVEKSRVESPFVDELASIARRLYLSTPHKSESEAQLLHDVMRGRYPMKTLERLSRIAQQSTRPEHRDALAEFIRQLSTPATHPPVHVSLAFDVETERQGLADVAQREFERRPSSASRERVIERLTAHYVAIRESISAVLSTAVHQ